MTKITILRATLLFLATSIFGLTAGAATNDITYSLSMPFPGATVWTVDGGPSTVSDFPFIGNALTLRTDGSGKITGVGWLWIDYVSSPYSAFQVDVTGRITSTAAKPTPTVTLTFRGPGYSLDGNGGSTENSINLKFVGQPGTAGTNAGIVGRLTGTVRGKSPLGEKSGSIDLSTIIQDATADELILTNKVTQNSKKMLLYTADLNGKGTINSAKHTYRFTITGLGDAKGSTLSVNGNLGPVTSSILTNVTFDAPVTGTAKGKIKGQVISATTSNITAEVITGN